LLDGAAEWQVARGADQWRPESFSDEVREVGAAGDLYVAKEEDEIVGCFMLEGTCPGWMVPSGHPRHRRIRASW